MRFLLALPIALALSACVTATKQPTADRVIPVPPDRISRAAYAGADKGSIVITRDVGLIGGGCFLGVLVDGQLAARFEPAERVTLDVEPGEYVLTATWVGGRGLCSFHDEKRAEARRRSLETNIPAGTSKAYRIYTNTDGDSSIEPTL